MPDLSNPETALIIAGVILGHALILGVLLGIFRPGEYGYFAQYGQGIGWLICLGVSAYFVATAIVLVRVPPLVSLFVSAVMWFAIALQVFRLTIRQTIKLNIAENTIFIVILFSIGAIAGG